VGKKKETKMEIGGMVSPCMIYLQVFFLLINYDDDDDGEP